MGNSVKGLTKVQADDVQSLTFLHLSVCHLIHPNCTDAPLCKNLQILSNYKISYAEDIVQPCYEMTGVGLIEERLASEIKSQEIKTI